jgi:peptide deformylase
MIITDEVLLRRPCEDVLPEEVDDLISILESELANANRLGKNGIGLAAAQINILKKIAIIRLGKITINLVNAKIEKGYDPVLFKDEGCLSVPNRTEDTIRFQEVYITNNLVEPHNFIATGLLAFACQHELDHLNSILFMDHKVPKQLPVVNKKKVGPNDLCLCGSNKKYKRCCKK